MIGTRRDFLAAAVAATPVLAGIGAGPARSQSKTLNIGFFPVVSVVPVMQAQKQMEAKGYTVNWVPLTQGLPGAASALAAGRLDASWGNSVAANVIFSQSPNAAQFIGQSFVNANVTVVATNSAIKSAADIRGKKVVVSGPRTASTLFFKIMLKKAGVDPEGNEYFVSGTGPGMVGVLDSGGAEVVAGYVPYVSDMVLKKIGRVLFTGSDAIGRSAPGDGFIARSAFIRDNPQATADLLAAQSSAMNFIKANPAQAIKMMADFAQVDEAAVRHSFDNGLIGVAPSIVPDVDGIVETVKIAQELGFAPDGVDLPSFARTFNNVALASSLPKT